MNTNIKDVISCAEQEIEQEEFRQAVEKIRKEKLRNGDWQKPGYDAHADIKCQVLAFG